MKRLTPKLLIELKVSTMEAALGRREVELGAEIDQLLASGMRREAAQAIVEGRIDDLVRLVAQDLTREVQSAINQMSFSSYWNEVVKTSAWFRWQYEPTAEHCDTCIARNGKVGTAEQMLSVGLPGAGTTDCRTGCRCRIVPVTEEQYDQGDKIA